MLDYLATAIIAVTAWECGRLAWRAASPVPVSASSPARVALLGEVADARSEAVISLVDGDGAAVLSTGLTPGMTCFMFAHRQDPNIRVLAPEQKAWLLSLSKDELAIVRKSLPTLIDKHLARRCQIVGLPWVQPIQPVVTLRGFERQSGGGPGGRKPR